MSSCAALAEVTPRRYNRMSTSSSTPDAEFTRRSPTVSICMYCCVTVRVKLHESLAVAEREHISECSERPASLPHKACSFT